MINPGSIIEFTPNEERPEVDELIEMLRKELDFHIEKPRPDNEMEEWRNGFLKGLNHAIAVLLLVQSKSR